MLLPFQGAGIKMHHACAAGCFQMGINGSAVLDRINISSISVSRLAGEQMLAKSSEGALVDIWLPR